MFGEINGEHEGREKDARTEPLFRRVAGLDDLNDTRAQRLNRWRVVGEDTHVTSCRREVHLDDIGGREDSLGSLVKGAPGESWLLARTWWGRTRDRLILSAASA